MINQCPDYHYHNCSRRETDCHICLVNSPDGELLYDPILPLSPHPLAKQACHLKQVAYAKSKVERTAVAKQRNLKRAQVKQGHQEELRILATIAKAGFNVTQTERSGAEYHNNDLLWEIHGQQWRVEVKKRTTGNSLVVKSHEANPAYLLVSTLKDGTSYVTMELSKLLEILNGFKE